MGVAAAVAWAAARSRALAVTLDCVGGPVPLGGLVRVRLRVTPARRVRFSMHRLRARLISVEAVRGENARQEVLYEERLALPIPVTLATPFEHEWAIRLPPQVPPTWHGSHCALETAVEVELPFWELGGTSTRVEVVVLPELARD
jgi:hypothetical protein